VAGEYNDWVIRRGDTFNPYIILKVSGTARNLAGYTATCVFYSKTTATTVFSLTESSGLTVTDALGKIQLNLTDEQTATVNQDLLSFKIELESGSGEKVTELVGTVTVVG